MFDIPMDLKYLEESIVAYEQEPIEKGKILFYGHSLFTRWGSGKWAERVRPMAQDICMKDGTPAVVNHGFGTSTTEERLYYYDRMVRPWEPRALVLANWGNDSMYGYSPEQSMHATAQLLAWARTDFPGIKLFLVEPHPTAKRKKDASLPDKWNNGLRELTKIREMLKIYADTHEDTTPIRRAMIFWGPSSGKRWTNCCKNKKKELSQNFYILRQLLLWLWAGCLELLF